MPKKSDITIPAFPWKIDYSSKLLSVGSCFSTQLSDYLSKHLFQISNNPYGTLYNPISILRSLNYSKEDFDNSILKRDGLYVSYLSHSDVRGEDSKTLINTLNDIALSLKEEINHLDVLILTWGSAKIYQLKDSNLITANCHKVPQKEFNSRLLTENEIIEEFDTLYQEIFKKNPDLKILLSVSPVRYLSDGFAMNSLSKSVLIKASHELVKKYANVFYFPSYEILLDDLRDYRYFEADLIHPNAIAVEYVMNKFEETFLEESTIKVKERISKIIKGLDHRAFNPKSDSFIQFLNNLEREIHNLPEEINSQILTERLEQLRNPI